MEAFQWGSWERNSLWRDTGILASADHSHALKPIEHYRRGKSPKKINRASLNVTEIGLLFAKVTSVPETKTFSNNKNIINH